MSFREHQDTGKKALRDTYSVELVNSDRLNISMEQCIQAKTEEFESD